MKVRIIVDSAADAAAAVADKLTVVPMTVCFGQQEYIHGVDLSNREFYEKLVESDALPTTSQATPYAFSQVFQAARDRGESVVAITLSAGLSGTYQSAMLAAAEFPGQVFVVDSGTVSVGIGVLAEYALGLSEQGLCAEEIAKELERMKQRVHVLAMLDTLEYLKKGGRISKTAAIAGELLAIKPVVCFEDGQIKVLGKARGSRQANNLLVSEIQKCGGVDFSRALLLGYTGLSDVLLQKYIRDSARLWDGYLQQLPQTLIGSVVGTHAGPGAVAVAFFAKEDREENL